ncbi:DUF4064 domain-containing protein [Lactobacillus terrae]|uniref:DUF4064 domain-containing protein n=1 Tax=Lactobacillus terrae TaxID=2269374 RepID=UPI000C1B7A53|nr:DUF4064 domain-containing protein [Lactobacillus terrae]
MKEQNTKEHEERKTAEKYINDKYFEKGNFWLKFRQTVIVILGWMCFIIPIYWTISATLFFNKKTLRTIWNYQEGRDLFYGFGRFFIIAFVVIALITIIFTIQNNYYTKHHTKKETKYDQERLLTRRNAMKDFYTEEFGQPEVRRSIKYYSVKPEQNLDSDTIREIYKEAEANK